MLSPNDAYMAAQIANRQGFYTTVTKTAAGVSTDQTAIASRVTIRRELAGDLPDSVSLTGGAVSTVATIDADLGAGAPNPMSAAAREAWLGKDVTIEAGYTGANLTVFTGRVRELAFDDSARSVTIGLMDNSDKMRVPVTLPAFGSSSSRLAPLAINRYPTNVSAVIVGALHDAGIRVTPPPRFPSQCIISVPLAFGMIADIGWTVPGGAGIAAGVDWLTPGKFAPTPTQFSDGVNAWTLKAYPNASGEIPTGYCQLMFEFWFHHTAGVASVSPSLNASTTKAMFLTINANNTFAFSGYYGAAAYGAPVALTTGWHHVAMSNANGTSQMWVDGVTVAFGSKAGLTGNVGTLISVDIPDPGKVQALHVYRNTSGTALAGPTLSTIAFTAGATVDRAALEVDLFGGVAGGIAWDLCKEIASAELGMVGFDEAGIFYFKNRANLNGVTAPVAVWDTDLVDNLAGAVSVDSIRTRVTSSVSRRWLTNAGRGANTEITTAVPSFIAAEVLTVPIGTTVFSFYSDTPFLPDSATVGNITAMGAAWEVDSGLVLCTSPTGSGRYATPTATQLTATIWPEGPGVWKLSIRNSTGAVMFMVWPTEWSDSASSTAPFGLVAGAPAFWINGRAIDPNASFPDVPVNVSNVTAITKWGDRTLALESSIWRQDVASVTALANSILADLKEPRLSMSDVTITGDPRLQIGDPVRLTDWQGRAPDVLARITSIELTLGYDVESGMSGKYGLRMLPS